MDLNKVMIIGRLTRDPEVRTTPNGKNVSSFSVATSYNWTDQQGQKKEQTEFHNVIAWGKLGEIIAQYCKKGKQLYIEGRIQTRSWDDKTSGKKQYRTEIIADSMIMLGSPSSSSSSSNAAAATPIISESPAPENPDIQIENSDMPF
jgi:single-strand DNA-binding protein